MEFVSLSISKSSLAGLCFLTPQPPHDLPAHHAGICGLDGVEIRSGLDEVPGIVAGVPLSGLRTAGHRLVQEGADERALSHRKCVAGRYRSRAARNSA